MRNYLQRALFSLLSLLAACAAQAFTVTLNVPGDNQVEVVISTDNGSTTRVLSAGDNPVEVENYNSLDVKGILPYEIVAVKDGNGNSEDTYFGGNSWYKFIISSDAGKTFIISTVNKEELRTGSCTVKVDDPTVIRATLEGSTTPLAFNAGYNPVKFNPETEKTLTVRRSDGGSYLYSVTVDGEPVSLLYGVYKVPLSEGCVVDIVAIIPDIDVTVNFIYPDGCADAISKVAVNDELRSDFNGSSLVVKAGDELAVYPNPMYQFAEDSFRFNGKTIYRTYYGYYSMTVMDNSTVELANVAPQPTYSVTVNVTDPAHIHLFAGDDSDDSSAEIMLTGTSSQVKVLQSNPKLCWKAASGIFINSVTADGRSVQGNSVSVTDGMTITFVSSEVLKDKTAYIWFDSYDPDDFIFLNFTDAQEESAGDMQPGYNMLKFNADMTPYELNWLSFEDGITGKVYRNEVEIVPEQSYPGEGEFTLDIADGDVYKVYFRTLPEVCNVDIELGAGVTATVTRDVITPVDNFEDGFSAFKGTELRIVPGADINVPLVFTVNGTAIEAGEDGAYTFTVEDASTKVSLAAKERGFDISIENLTAGFATICVEPTDKELMYVWNCAEKEIYDNVGPEQVITNTVDAWREFSQIMGISMAEIMSSQCSVGDVRRLDGPYKSDTDYVVYAFSLDMDLNVVIPTKEYYFHTLAPEPSDNTFEVEVTGFTRTVNKYGKTCATATIKVTPSNDDEYTVFCLEKHEVETYDFTPGCASEKQFGADYVVNCALQHRFTGEQTLEIEDVTINALMYAVVVGVDKFNMSTPAKLVEFTTIDPEFEVLSVAVTDPGITDAHVNISSFDNNSRAFYWGVIRKDELESIGGAEEIYEKVNKPYWTEQATWYNWEWWQYAAAVLTRKEVNGALCASAGVSPRRWDTDYVVYAYLMDEGGNKVSSTYTSEFRTLSRNSTDLEFEIDLLSVTPNGEIAPGTYTAEFRVTPSDDTKEWAVYYKTAEDYDRYENDPELTDDDFMYDIFLKGRAKGLYTGMLEFGYGGVREGKEYVVICAGYDEAPNTRAYVMRYTSEGKVSSIDNASADDVRIYTIPGGIVIDGDYDHAEVYTIDGRKKADMHMNCLRGLAQGVYVVRVAHGGEITTSKVLVK